MGIIERCPICDKVSVILQVPINYSDENLGIWVHEECLEKKFDGGWRVGRMERNEGNVITVEYLCIHGIGHWRFAHACDRCCQRDDYPGRKM